jgi:hypothetical protein
MRAHERNLLGLFLLVVELSLIHIFSPVAFAPPFSHATLAHAKPRRREINAPIMNPRVTAL